MPESSDHQRPEHVKELSFTGPVRLVVFPIAGLLAGIATCLAMWLIMGGWGPPALMLFVVLGLIVGILAAFAKPAKRPTK